MVDVILPDGLLFIGNSAFSSCISLEKIIIPKGVEVIKNHAFDNCSSLIIYCEAEKRPSAWDNEWRPITTKTHWGYVEENK